MSHILLFGAGRSASYLIEYLDSYAQAHHHTFTIADTAIQARQEGNVYYKKIDIHNELDRTALIAEADIVLSLLPPSLHLLIAQDCLLYKKHFLTASYASAEIKAMHTAAKNHGLVFLMECGLDPGIDHLSAMQEIDALHALGAKLIAFKSYTGGLVAPESDNNPWHYKITWNPRNVVLAGQGTATYLENGSYKYIPYHRIFADYTTLSVPGYGNFEGYANRDSLSYIQTYGLEGIKSFIRGTLRRPHFCDAWNLLVQLGLTDDSYILPNSEHLTWRQFTTSYLRENPRKKINHQLGALLAKGPGAQEIQKLKWLGLLDETATGIANASPARLLQNRLEEKLMMHPDDLDMIVMQHIFEYELNHSQYRRTCSLVLKGESAQRTAMAKTVGLPLAIATKLLLEGSINERGVVVPTTKEFYEPILNELRGQGIQFIANEVKIS